MSIMEIALIILALNSVIVFKLVPTLFGFLVIIDILIRHGILNVN